MSDASSSGIGVLGVWQAVNFVLYTGIDSPVNKVQNWPVWNWWAVESVMFPFMAGLLVAVVALTIIGLVKLFE